MKIKKTRRLLDFLLQPLGLKTCKTPSAVYYYTIDYHQCITCVCTDEEHDSFIVDISTAFDKLFSRIVYFGLIADYALHHIADNPYLGCKNLEEAMIRRDLIKPTAY